MDSSTLRQLLSDKLIGQQEAIDAIIPVCTMHNSGLSPEGRPIGSLMLLGPTGVGKTRTVEALAECLHHKANNIVKVNCGEFQMDHEVAKLIGAPPGYIGHRETVPMLNQARLNAVASEYCDMSLVLFDEIEKASPGLQRMLLGILDKAELRLGDSNVVSFEKCLIFFTSNLGARETQEEISGGFGYGKYAGKNSRSSYCRLKQISQAAVKRKFSPELINRIDHFVTYKPLGIKESLAIVDIELGKLGELITTRLGLRSLDMVNVHESARKWLAKNGTSPQYGARELKRLIHKELVYPLALMIENREAYPGAELDVIASKNGLSIKVCEREGKVA